MSVVDIEVALVLFRKMMRRKECWNWARYIYKIKKGIVGGNF
jgi:hypothetical protein